LAAFNFAPLLPPAVLRSAFPPASAASKSGGNTARAASSTWSDNGPSGWFSCSLLRFSA
jgi:hypothetical protein